MNELIIGLMSGTSMDGLDVALCRFGGSGSQTQMVVEKFETITFSEDIKEEKHEKLVSMLWGKGEQMRLENINEN